MEMIFLQSLYMKTVDKSSNLPLDFNQPNTETDLQ